MGGDFYPRYNRRWREGVRIDVDMYPSEYIVVQNCELFMIRKSGDDPPAGDRRDEGFGGWEHGWVVIILLKQTDGYIAPKP
jgi:hypothetical protein